MIFSQPTPPPQLPVIESPPSTVEVTQPAASPVATPSPLPTPSSIASPEAMPPEASSEGLGPEPAASPQPSPSPAAASQTEPTAVSSPSPSPRPTVDIEELRPTFSESPVPNADQAATTAKDSIEQRLEELIAKDPRQQQALIRQKLIALVLRYLKAGEFEKARQVAKNPALPPELQAKLLREISAFQARSMRLATAPAAANGRSQAKAAAERPTDGSAPSAVPPNYSVASFYSPSYKGPVPPQLSALRGLIKGLLFPLAIPAPITSVFGWRIHPISGVPRFHQGLDLGAPSGTPVLAAHTGTVELADFLGGYGLTVILRHANNTQSTLYGHLSQIFVKPGELIQQGAVIALVGSTGYSTGPHLHFEVQQWTDQGWVAVDPLPALNQTVQLANGAIPQTSLLPQPPIRPEFSVKLPSQLSSLLPGLIPPLQAGSLFPSHPLLANTPFAGVVNPTVTHQMGLLFPLAFSTPMVPELGWVVYPLISQFTQGPAEPSTPDLAPREVEPMPTFSHLSGATAPWQLTSANGNPALRRQPLRSEIAQSGVQPPTQLSQNLPVVKVPATLQSPSSAR